MDEDAAADAKIIIYTVAGCPFCARAKQLFESLDVPYVEHEISQDETKAEELIKLTGRALVPVTLIAGRTIIGFDKEQLEEAIQKIKKT